MTYSSYLALTLATVGSNGPTSTAESTPELSDALEPALDRIHAVVEGLRRGPLKPRRVLADYPSQVYSLSFRPDGQELAVAGAAKVHIFAVGPLQ